MEKVMVDIRDENEVIREVFENKDLVSVDEMLNTIDDLKYQIECLKEKIEDLETPNEYDNSDELHDLYMAGLL